MNESGNENSKRRRSLPLRFSLRTMLFVTLMAAVICAWLLRPKRQDLELAGGAMRIRAQVTYPTADKSIPQFDPVEPMLNGRGTLLDRDGRRLATGYYEDNLPVGCWTYYHANGREALSGQVAHEIRQGSWIARFDSGKPRSQTTEKQIEHSALGGGYKGWPSKSLLWSAIRDGPAEQYWETGHLRVQGEYRDDLREGDWTFFDRDGRRVAAGPYRRGIRHGTWRRWETADGQPQIDEFVDGRRLPKLDDLLPELTEQLLGNDAGQQVRAACQLNVLGSAAVPALEKAIATDDVRRQLLAVRTLRQIGPAAKSAAEEVSRLAEQSHPRLKCDSLVALAELDPDRAEACHHRLLQYATGNDRRLRDAAEAALACAGPAGLKSLEAALMDDAPAIRYAALASLARMLRRRLDAPVAPNTRGEAPPIIEIRAVLEAAQENPDEKIRAAAKWMKGMQKIPEWRGLRSIIPVVG